MHASRKAWKDSWSEKMSIPVSGFFLFLGKNLGIHIANSICTAVSDASHSFLSQNVNNCYDLAQNR